MNREYKPTSRLLRSVFVVCAATMTVAIVLFIGMLSDRSAVGALAAIAAGSIAAHG